MAEQVNETTEGEGYAVGTIDTLGAGHGFRKIRTGLGVTAFGINAIVVPPGYAGRPHFHDVQEETYFVHRGRIEIEFGDGRSFELGPGGVARVDAPTHRTVRNIGDEDAVYVAIGGAGGYVGRDGRTADGEQIGGPPGAR